MWIYLNLVHLNNCRVFRDAYGPQFFFASNDKHILALSLSIASVEGLLAISKPHFLTTTSYTYPKLLICGCAHG